MDMSPTDSFGFRATGKCNICLCRYMGMAKMAKTWCVGGKVAIRTAMDMSPINSFGFRAHAQEDVALASGPEP